MRTHLPLIAAVPLLGVLLLLTGCGAIPTAGTAPTAASRDQPAPLVAGPTTNVAPTTAAAATVTTTTGATTPTAVAPPVTGAPTVVLDPGHNGGNAGHPAQINRQVPDGRGGAKACNTSGTSTDAGYPEHAFTWDVALRVRELLTAGGVRVALTRPDDTGVGPCVDQRGALANQAGAVAVVSIHADGAPPSGRGFHVAYSDPPLNPAQGALSIGLAGTLRDAMRSAGFPPATYIGSSGMDPRADLAGLNFARIPAALVECANMRNPAEAALLTTPDGRARYAAALAAGILGWLAHR